MTSSTLFFIFLIITPHYLQAATWTEYYGAPAVPASSKCLSCPPPTTTYPAKTVTAPVTVPVITNPCCKTYSVVKPCKPCVPVTTPAPPPVYTLKPCLPPTCYTDLAKQKSELENIYKQGSQLMVDYSSQATGPVVFVAQTISNGADLIPSFFAAGGDLLGKAIATPIQFFNRIGMSLLSGAISQIVTIPISFSTSARASTVLLQPYMRWFGLGGADAPYTCCPPPSPGAFEQIGLKPLGVLTGPIHLAMGSFLSLGGATFRLIGTLTKSGGEAVENTGLNFKNIGALKVADGVKSVASFLSEVGNSQSPTICVFDGKEYKFFQQMPVSSNIVPNYEPTTPAPYITTPKPIYTTSYPTEVPTTTKLVETYTTAYSTPYTMPYTTPYTTAATTPYAPIVTPPPPMTLPPYGTYVDPNSSLLLPKDPKDPGYDDDEVDEA